MESWRGVGKQYLFGIGSENIISKKWSQVKHSPIALAHSRIEYSSFSACSFWSKRMCAVCVYVLCLQISIIAVMQQEKIRRRSRSRYEEWKLRMRDEIDDVEGGVGIRRKKRLCWLCEYEKVWEIYVRHLDDTCHFQRQWFSQTATAIKMIMYYLRMQILVWHVCSRKKS
jgi:hypothetical protein